MDKPTKKPITEYEKTVLVDFDELMKRTTPCHEVPDKSVYKHKPLKNQGRFANKR